MKEPELSTYSETELLKMVGAILSHPGGVTTLDHECLEAINSEFRARFYKEKQQHGD